MNIAIVGSRMIPARYGGFETFVEEISLRLKKKGFGIYVTCESDRFFEDEYKGIKRVHIHSFHGKGFTIPSINDMISTVYLLLKYSKKIDVICYVSTDGTLSAIVAKLLRKKIFINPDGLEWKRLEKRSIFAKFFLKPIYFITKLYFYLMESLSCKISDIIIADSIEIKKYLEKKHNVKNVVNISYGARNLISSELSEEEEYRVLKRYGLSQNDYFFTISRIVAENNIDMEIKGFKKSKSNKKLVIVGNFNENDMYTKNLFKIKEENENILFLDPIYDKQTLGILRKNCFAYIHAYEVGGTNPSLLEQMPFGAPVLAYGVPFNKEVLQEGGIYFRDFEDLATNMEMLEKGKFDLELLSKTFNKRLEIDYNWDVVTKKYFNLFNQFNK